MLDKRLMQVLGTAGRGARSGEDDEILTRQICPQLTKTLANDSFYPIAIDGTASVFSGDGQTETRRPAGVVMGEDDETPVD